MKKFPKKNVLSFCFFDFGLSSFPTLILTFFYGAYYVKIISHDPVVGASRWGLMISISSLLSLVLFCFIIFNYSNAKKKSIETFQIFFKFLILSCLCLFFFKDGSNTTLPLFFVSIGFIAFEILNFFYNISLSKVSNSRNIGFISNLGWAFGYLGGLISLGIVLLFIKVFNGDIVLSWIGPFVGIWTYFFCRKHLINSIKVAFFPSTFKKFLKDILSKKIGNFVVSFFFFQNAIVCTFVFSGIYASQQLGFSEAQILLLGVSVNFFGIIGCLVLGILEKQLKSKNTIKVSLFALIILSSFLLSFSNVIIFWITALFIGFFVGPLQASSRAFLSRGINYKEQYSGFAFYSALGNFCSIIGPFFISKALIFSNSLNLSLYLIPVYYFLGYILFFRVKINA